MKKAIYLSLIIVVIMSAAIIWAFITGDFILEGNWIIKNPWGIVSLVDIYSSMAIFAAWIIMRERSVMKISFSMLGLIILGSLGAALYILLTLMDSKGDWNKFFLGEKKI